MDLVLTHPMTSMSGYVAYLKYEVGTTIGQSKQDDLLNSYKALGNYDQNYTGNVVVESFDSGVTSGSTKVTWTQNIVTGPIHVYDATGAELKGTSLDYGATIAADGTITVETGVTAGDIRKVAYTYDNTIIPQEKIPTVKARMDKMDLLAKARRVAIVFSQFAAFEAKTDYGFDLAQGLIEQAQSVLNYNIDTEIINLLYTTAKEKTTENLTWDATQPIGVNMVDHYNSFSKTIEDAKQIVYRRCKRFAPNYMVCSSYVLPFLTFNNNWKAAPTGVVNGPYYAGQLGSLKVYVSPELDGGDFFLGVNGSDLMTSAAVFAPYMPLVPTQLLGLPDGGQTQGWSTLYDVKILNDNLLVYGKIVNY